MTRSELQIMYIELRDWQVTYSLDEYEKIGPDNFTPKQKRTYAMLVKQQVKLDEKRTKLLGLSTD